MGQVHRFLGLSVGLIQQDMRPEERRRNYNCDITYATNSELRLFAGQHGRGHKRGGAEGVSVLRY